MATSIQNEEDELTPFHTTDSHEPVQFSMYKILPHGLAGNLSLAGLTEGNTKEYSDRLANILLPFNVRMVYAPSASYMSGRFADCSEYTQDFEICPTITVKRPVKPADAVEILPGEAGMFSLGGCGGGTFTFNDSSGKSHCLYFHAGLNSVIDMGEVHKIETPRDAFSVIDAVVDRGIALGGVPERMYLRVFGLVPWEGLRYSTDDITFGESNFILVNFLESMFGPDSGVIQYCPEFHEHICMETIIRLQAENRGIRTMNFHGLRLNGKLPFVTHPNKRLGGLLRYLQLLIRL